MEINRFFTTLLILALLCACQTEGPQENYTSKRVLTIRGTLPGDKDTRSYISFGNPELGTRAQITYGNRDHNKEIFMWDKKGYGGLANNDYVALYNITRLIQCQPEGIQLDVIDTIGRVAIFESVESVDPNVVFKAGDLVFVNYGSTRIRQINTAGDYDERKVFTIDVGTESNKPQIIEKNPDNSTLAYMHHNLRMYDIVTVVKDDSIPDLHFKHLSAILRVSLRNETGKDLYPTKLEYKYPGTKSFFNTTMYCSIDTTLSSGLKIYDDSEIMNGSDPYTDNIGTTINSKDNTEDFGDVITPGQTYDLYISTVPRIDNKQTGNGLTINLITNHDTNHPYTITLDGFNLPIEAGKRYWFNLTAVTENDTINKLMLTNEWLKAHPDAKPYYE